VGKGERFARAVPTRRIGPRGHGAARHSRARAFAHPTNASDSVIEQFTIRLNQQRS